MLNGRRKTDKRDNSFVETDIQESKPLKESKKEENSTVADDKRRRLPLRSRKDSICEEKHLPGNCTEIYQRGCFVIYENDELKSFFVLSNDYHNEKLSVNLSVFDGPLKSSITHEAEKKKRSTDIGDKEKVFSETYYSGVAWSIVCDYLSSKIIFDMIDYHSNCLKLPYAEVKKIIKKFKVKC